MRHIRTYPGWETNVDRQRSFKKRRASEGFKQIQLWVHRETDPKRKRPDIADFVRYVDALTGTWSETKKSKFFTELIEIIKTKQEVNGKKVSTNREG